MINVKLFIISYESSQWCGGQSHCLVYAYNESQPEELASFYMDESMRELFSSEYFDDQEDGGDLDEDQAYTVHSVEELTPDHEMWQYVQDPVQQAHFYPYINSPDNLE